MESQVPYLVDRLNQTAQATAQISAQLVASAVELSAQVAKLGELESDVVIGAGQYHDCPVELAPVAVIAEHVRMGDLVLVEDQRRVLYRVQSVNVEDDAMLIAPAKQESSARSVSKAGQFIYGWFVWPKVKGV
jgi:UDP-3-O-[3-hydroxymyristoyl] glucosamine N-acyltransferase